MYWSEWGKIYHRSSTIHQQYFKDRAIYYSSRLLNDQAPRGDNWDYSLKEVYFIGIMDSLLEDSDTAEYIHYIRLAYEKSNQEFYKKLGYICIEIPKFSKLENELETGVDKWLFILKNLSMMQKIPVILSTKIFLKLFQIASVANLNKVEYMKYEKDLMASWDEYAIKKTLLEEGMKKGIEVKSFEFVKNMLLSGEFEIAKIAALANVTEEFVRKVKREISKH